MLQYTFMPYSGKSHNAFQHDVDVVIEVPEKGRTVQMGRFNQGGQMIYSKRFKSIFLTA